MRDRSREINMFQDTMQILEQGYYEKNGKKVKLKLSRKDMETIRVYLPEDVKKEGNDPNFIKPIVIGRCEHDCKNKDSFGYAREKMGEIYYAERKRKLLVLNLANPVNPGGGVRRGARAQEEDLCRKSSLLISLESEKAKKYYDFNKSLNTYMGSDALMITPCVEIIKDENGELLDDTVVVSALTCAAPMITEGKEGLSEEEYESMVYNRIVGMLKCVAHLGYQELVLGAWGCGAFGNDAHVVSDLFYKALKELEYNGLEEKDLFEGVYFAVLDRTSEQYNYKEFCRNFTQENFYREEAQKSIDKAKERIRETEVHLNRIRGCLVGGAAGDALGYAIEFKKESYIFSKYGENGITEYELDRKSGKALISDDTQMTLFTANGLLVGDTRGKLRGIRATPRCYVAHAYSDWYDSQHFTFEEYAKIRRQERYRCRSWLMDVPEMFERRAPGNTCLSALEGRQDGDGEYPGIDHPANTSKGCGGIMRVAPIALDYQVSELDELDKEGAELAAITHGHSLGYMPAAVLTHIINRIVYGDKKLTLKDIVIEAKDTVARIFAGDKHLKELTDVIDLAVELSENKEHDLSNIHRIGEGWVAEETLGIALYCALRYKDDFSAGIIASVNHNGDSDSTGAVTGNILGALLGYDAIEEKWKKNLELIDVIIEMADDLCHGCQMSEFDYDYRDLDWERKYLDMKWKAQKKVENSISIQKLYISGKEVDAVFFHKPEEPDGYLSNWYISPFDLDGIHYTSMEQYIMYQKCIVFGDKKSADAVLATNDTGKQQEIGRNAAGYIGKVWEGMRQVVALRGLYAKFSQNTELCQKLMDTGDAYLVECARKDVTWACGRTLDSDEKHYADKWLGQNILGFALMEVRAGLRAHKSGE